MATYPTPSLPIKAWAEDDRPREKLLLKGAHSLSDAELIAILLGSGSRDESALALAQRLLRHFHQDISELARASLADLRHFRGIGEAKAVSIQAALELGRRRQSCEARERKTISSSRDAYEWLRPLVADLDHEQFWILLLNRANKVMGAEQVSIGGMTGTVVDPKIIFRRALQGQATSLILCHNHPSGNVQPSAADLDITRKLRRAGEHLEIPVLDHLIITQSAYHSFADEGLMS